MAKKKKVTRKRDNKKLLTIIILLLIFAAGFLIARARYKPQIKATYNMVIERESAISDLKDQVKALEGKIEVQKKF